MGNAKRGRGITMERGTVFRNEHESNGEKWYSYNFSKAGKDRNGTKIYASIPIRFRKGIEPDNKSYVELKDFFLTPFPYGKTENGKQKTVMGIMCLDFAEVITREEAGREETPEGFAMISDDDIPF